MKRLLSFLFVFFLVFTITAQTQVGYVKTKGRLGTDGNVIPGSRLGGVTLMLRGRSAIVSDSNGDFSFPIVESKFALQSVAKKGYVLTDPDILSLQYSYSANPLIIVLETPESYTEDLLVAERKIRRSLQRDLLKKEEELEALKEQNRITVEEYRARLQEIYRQQEKDENLIAEMAERYAKIDYDQIDEFNRQVNEYILNGELTKADSMLNTKGDIHADIAELHKIEAAIEKESNDIAQSRDKVNKSIGYEHYKTNETAHNCYVKYEVFKSKNQLDSAAYYIKLRAGLDTTNMQWQRDAADFFCEINDFIQAVELYALALRIAECVYGVEAQESLNVASALNDCYLKMFEANTMSEDNRQSYHEFNLKYGKLLDAN